MRTENLREEKPTYKAIKKGFAALTNAELIAAIAGNRKGAMSNLLSACKHNLNVLAKKDLAELCEFEGVGPATAVAIMAAFELGKRRSMDEVIDRDKITCSTDVYKLFWPLMCDLHTEEFWVLFLNQGNKIIDYVNVSKGGIAETIVDVRCILREALIKRAVSIVLVHNHPSGATRPSLHDDKLTQKVREAGNCMNISLTDHVIITDGDYYSYADEGRI